MEKDQSYYRLFDHTADLGMEIFGDSAAQVFINAAKSIFEVITGSKLGNLDSKHQLRIDVDGEDWADLMVNWLRELLYLCNGKQQIVHQLEIEFISEHNLRAVVTADDFDPAKHKIDKEIKAVTYHQIAVLHDVNGWRAKVIFDV